MRLNVRGYDNFLSVRRIDTNIEQMGKKNQDGGQQASPSSPGK